LILIASLSNIAFKGTMAAVLGGRELMRHLTPAFGVLLAAGLVILWAWPGT
jgi:uncharacterized membrane protein (DUF4010 family)